MHDASYLLLCRRPEWRPSFAPFCNAEMRRSARLVLLLHKRRECSMSVLPKDVVMLIIGAIMAAMIADEEERAIAQVEENVWASVAQHMKSDADNAVPAAPPD